VDNVLAREESTPIHTTAPAMANKLATSKAPNGQVEPYYTDLRHYQCSL